MATTTTKSTEKTTTSAYTRKNDTYSLPHWPCGFNVRLSPFFITILNACIISITYRWCLDISWFLYFGWQFNIRAILLSERVHLFIYFFISFSCFYCNYTNELQFYDAETGKLRNGSWVFFFLYSFLVRLFDVIIRSLMIFAHLRVCIPRSYRWLFHFYSVFIFYTYGLVFSRLGLFAKHKNAALFFSRVFFFIFA